jgi:23S rRNA pseudouridine955/2504/2580 synthase
MINQRIDNFMHKKFKNAPKNMIYRIIRTGKVRVNKKKIAPFYKLKIGDILNIPPIQVPYKKRNIFILERTKNILLNHVLYEDESLLIVNKPSGIAVHGGSGLKFGIIEFFRQCYPKNRFLELVHRIDRETSGIVMIAKKRLALISLHEQFRKNNIQKKYIALVHGLWPLNIKKISQPIKKKLFNNQKQKVFIAQTGKFAETYFKINKQYSRTTLLDIFPKTGRTHQIRVHTSHIGHPILFDTRYGQHDLDNNINNKIKINRMLLHASEIHFTHPQNAKKIKITAPLEIKFQKYLNAMI